MVMEAAWLQLQHLPIKEGSGLLGLGFQNAPVVAKLDLCFPLSTVITLV
jgi:hypothetical protein